MENLIPKQKIVRWNGGGEGEMEGGWEDEMEGGEMEDGGGHIYAFKKFF